LLVVGVGELTAAVVVQVVSARALDCL